MKRERLAVAMLCAGVFLLYGVFSILNHLHFGTSAYDLGIFDQAIWNVSQGLPPSSDIRGVHNLLGDHFHPIIFLLAPLVAIFHSVAVLLWAQAALVAISVLPVYVSAKKYVGSLPAFLLSIAYSLFWGIQQMVAFDFHEIAFALPLIACMLVAVQSQRWLLYALCALGVLLTKEDLSLLVVGFGLLLITRKKWLVGGVSVVGGLLWFEVITRVVIPHFAGGQYSHWTYNQFGPDAQSAALNAVTHPSFTLHEFFLPKTKLKTLWYLFHPWLFMPFLSPLSLLTLPLLAARFLSQVPAWWSIGFHYNATIAPILVVSAADGLARISSFKLLRKYPVALFGAACIGVISLILVKQFPLHHLFSLSFYRLSYSDQVGLRALQQIPGNASVTAQGSIISHLSEREHIETLDHGASGLQYIIASTTAGTYPLPEHIATNKVLQETLDKHHYVQLFNQDGWVVYRD